MVEVVVTVVVTVVGTWREERAINNTLSHTIEEDLNVLGQGRERSS